MTYEVVTTLTTVQVRRCLEWRNKRHQSFFCVVGI